MTRHRLALTAGIFLLGAASVLVVDRVRAAGIPAANAFTYTGYLEDPAGNPVSGPTNIAIHIYNAAEGGDDVCEAPSAEISVNAGHFQVALPDACSDAVKANPDVWLEVQVDGASLGRTKLGAVPYAVEAGHATTADTAAAAELAASATNASVLMEDDSTAPLQFKRGTFTVDNGNTARPTIASLNWGYGELSWELYITAIRLESGLHNGCSVTPRLEAVHTGNPRIFVDIVGVSNNVCADVGELTFTYLYLDPTP